MDTITVVGACAALLMAALFIGWVWVRSTRFRRVRRPPAETPPPEWTELIEQRVPITRTLTAEQRDQLLGLVSRFIREKRFEGCGGLLVTEDMKVIIAAQACLLILELDAGCYPNVRTVLVYPGTFIPGPPPLEGRIHVLPVPTPAPTLGEHVSGAVVLSWESAEQGALRTDAGHNLVFHEFAHELDREDGYVDGIPLLEAPRSTPAFARVLNRRFEELRRDAGSDQPSFLDRYGATSRAEFFAVATETFFERPVELQRRYPDLYEELKGFFRQDPAGRVSGAP